VGSGFRERCLYIGFGAVPLLVAADALVGAGRQLHLVIGETEVAVDEVEQRAETLGFIDQLVDETKRFCTLLDLVYRDLGFPDYKVKLATRPDERIGSDEEWNRAEADVETPLTEPRPD